MHVSGSNSDSGAPSYTFVHLDIVTPSGWSRMTDMSSTRIDIVHLREGNLQPRYSTIVLLVRTYESLTRVARE